MQSNQKKRVKDCDNDAKKYLYLQRARKPTALAVG